ncbi:unnamed protein product, partial [Urochloa humidicola]
GRPAGAEGVDDHQAEETDSLLYPSQCTWLLNLGMATAVLGQREILPDFSHHTSSTAGGFPPPDGGVNFIIIFITLSTIFMLYARLDSMMEKPMDRIVSMP